MKELSKILILANRLAESILMDWDKEEQIKLAGEVAVECHSIIHEGNNSSLLTLIKDMRNVQRQYELLPKNATIEMRSSLNLEKSYLEMELDSIRTVREYCTEHSRIWLEIYEDNPKVCIFTHLLVDEDYRQKGYGTKALEQAETIAKDLGCDTIYLKVETYSWMSKWYLRSGYTFLTNAEDNYTWLTKSI